MISYCYSGRPGGELAWYINGLLAPELTLTRGEKYTFEVFGGSLETNGTSDTDGSHPFYITNSPSGGRLRNQGQVSGLQRLVMILLLVDYSG